MVPTFPVEFVSDASRPFSLIRDLKKLPFLWYECGDDSKSPFIKFCVPDHLAYLRKELLNDGGNVLLVQAGGFPGAPPDRAFGLAGVGVLFHDAPAIFWARASEGDAPSASFAAIVFR